MHSEDRGAIVYHYHEIGGRAMTKMFPVIDPVATGKNIVRLRKSRGLTVRDLQLWFGFEEPQAIYKWQKGKSLPDGIPCRREPAAKFRFAWKAVR